MSREIVEGTENEIGDITSGDRLDRVVLGIWILMFLLTEVKGGEDQETIGEVKGGTIDTAKRGGQLLMSEEEGEKSFGTGMRRGRRGETIGGRLGVEVLTVRETATEGIVIGILTDGEVEGEGP